MRWTNPLLKALGLVLVCITATRAADPVVNARSDPAAPSVTTHSVDQQQSAPDPAALLRSLARPAPLETAFSERRESPLLSEPLFLSGWLQQPLQGILIKSVESPFVERMQIGDGKVSVERDGESIRRFSLRRAPELVAISAGFEAMLSGDIDLLTRHFLLQMHGSAEAWQLEMIPRDKRLAKRVTSMQLLGSGDKLRCIDLNQQGEERSRMWLDEVAAAALAASDDGARDALCAQSSD